MSAPVRLVLFGVLLVALGFAGAGLGAVTGPIGPTGSTSEQHERGVHDDAGEPHEESS